MDNWKKYLEEQESQPIKGQYQSQIESFEISDGKEKDKRNYTFVSLVQVRGDFAYSQSGAEMKVTSDFKSYRSSAGNNVTYSIVKTDSPSVEALTEVPYTIQLVIKKIKDGKVLDKEVYDHQGLSLSPEMQAKYDEAKKGLINLGGD